MKGFMKTLLKIIAIVIVIVIAWYAFGLAGAFPEITAWFTSNVPMLGSFAQWVGGAIEAGKWGQLASVGLGALAVASPSSVTALGEVAADAVHTVTGAATDVIGGAVGGVLGSSSFLWLALAGVGLYLYMNRDRSGESADLENESKKLALQEKRLALANVSKGTQ